MSQSGIQVKVQSLEASQFTEALAAGVASAMYDIQLPRGAFGRTFLRSIGIVSVQNCAWELDWFSANPGLTADPQTDAWLGRWQFVEQDGQQIGGAGLWRYFIPDLNQPYQDLQNCNKAGPQFLHLILINKSVANGKLAGGAGNIVVTANLEPLEEGV